MMNPDTQFRLIAGAVAGDRFAAERLLELHRKIVLQIAYQALGNVDDACDVAQETLVYALSRLADLRDRTRFSAWLRQLPLSHAADYRRRRGTRSLGEPLSVLHQACEETDFTRRLMLREAL